MGYGLVIKNPSGQILVDGQRKMPKLHAQGRVCTSGEFSEDPVLGWYTYAHFDFPPTRNLVFATLAADEVASQNTPLLRSPKLIRDANGMFHRVRVEARLPNTYVFVWVYFL